MSAWITDASNRYIYGTSIGSPNIVIVNAAPLAFQKKPLNNEGQDTVAFATALFTDEEIQYLDKALRSVLSIARSNRVTSSTMNDAQIYNYLKYAEATSSFTTSLNALFGMLHAPILQDRIETSILKTAFGMTTQDEFESNYGAYLQRLSRVLIPQSMVEFNTMLHTPFMDDVEASAVKLFANLVEVASATPVTDIQTTLADFCDTWD